MLVSCIKGQMQSNHVMFNKLYGKSVGHKASVAAVKAAFKFNTVNIFTMNSY